MALDPRRFGIERTAEEIARAEGFSWDVLVAAEMCMNLFRLKAEAALRADQRCLIKDQLRTPTGTSDVSSTGRPPYDAISTELSADLAPELR
jgi:hypothetical protein